MLSWDSPNRCNKWKHQLDIVFIIFLILQYHPDAAKTAEAARFVKITEAYQTLVKPSTRKDYDDSLLWNPGGSGARNTHHSWEVKPNYSPNPGPYYGIRGLNRVSNWKVAIFLMSLGIIGAIFGFSSVK